MASLSIAEGFKNLIDGASPAVISGTWVCKISQLPETPNTCIATFDTPGATPNPKWLLDFPTGQILVRGDIDDYSGAYAKARQVHDVLLGLQPQTVGDDHWDGITGMGSLHFLHYDEKRRPIFTANYRLIIEPAATPHTNREPL